MCVFCASIPVAVALGASAKNRQNQQKKAAAADETAGADGEKPARLEIPAGPATALVVAALVTGSVIVHTQLYR